MTSDGTGTDSEAHIDGVDPDELIGGDRLEPTPEQHERLKDGLHGDRFKTIKRADRRYLVIGRGDGGPGQRRREVRTLLDERVGATAFMLEEFGFTGDDVDLWAPAFDVLSEMATHVVGILEDYDGGHVWELGFLYHSQTRIRDVLWLLKRVYDSHEKMRDRYDNGMAASHLAALEEAAGDRVVPWEEPDDIPDAVESIP
jgi:hypothetical protein